MQCTLEVPIDSLAAADVAGPYADRLEVCSDLSSEGWSPDPWLVRAIRSRTNSTVVAMIRPRVAGAVASLGAEAFVCTPALLDTCLREIDALARAGAHSVAIGPLAGDGAIDLHACERMLEVARGHGLSVSFLRTFDLLTDRERGMRDVVALGFDRLLTAGVRGWNASVKPLDARMAEVARIIEIGRAEAGRLGRSPVEVMPCGGVRAANAPQWLAITPHMHASCRRGACIDAAEVAALHALVHADGRERPALSPRPSPASPAGSIHPAPARTPRRA